MHRNLGTYLNQHSPGESYKAYIPAKLPPEPPIDLAQIYPALERATRAIAELNLSTKSIPNPTLFTYMYVRKEALLSSQIEGTQSSLSDLILFEHQEKTNVSLADVEEVSHYVKAIYHGLRRLKGNFPLSLRLLREIHGILLSGTRGLGKLPGEFRRSQNWIGGTRPGNALFVPPPVEHLAQCLSDFERFLHDDQCPTLIRAGLAHVQFETIHPFLDGNGRLGRLLIILMLCESGLLEEPVLYISLQLKQQRQTYYRLLQEVRMHGTWETWLEFFLDSVSKAAKQALLTTEKINTLFRQDFEKLESLGRMRFSCIKAFEHMKQLPQTSVRRLCNDFSMTAPTARNTLETMVTLGILEEITARKRDKIYVYRKYLKILEEGAEPLAAD